MNHQHHHSNRFLNTQNLYLLWDRISHYTTLVECAFWNKLWRKACACSSSIRNPSLLCTGDFKFGLQVLWLHLGRCPGAVMHLLKAVAIPTLMDVRGEGRRVPCCCLALGCIQTSLNPQTFVCQRQQYLAAPCRAIHEIKLFDVLDSSLVRSRTWINYNDVNQPRGGPIFLCVFTVQRVCSLKQTSEVLFFF